LKKSKITVGDVVINAIFILLALSYILPLCMVITTSFATQEAIANYGYTFFPKSFTTDAYKYIFKSGGQLVKSYRFTLILVCFIPFYLYMQGLTAYGLMRAKWGYKFLRIVYFSGFFGGGLIPTYIINTQYLHLDGTIWIYVLPAIYSLWNIVLLRTFFRNNPPGLIEAAKIDGAGEFKIYSRIVIPISLPIFATMLITTFIGIWNEWTTSMLYCSRNENMWTLGYMLQSILKKAALEEQMKEMTIELDLGGKTVEETLKYATLVVAAAPGCIIMPFFQKYFQKGIIVGSIKE